MNVSKLIQHLSVFPPDMPVMIRGYEGGYNDVGTLEKVPIKLNQNDQWYYGKHDSPGRGEEADVVAVLITA